MQTVDGTGGGHQRVVLFRARVPCGCCHETISTNPNTLYTRKWSNINDNASNVMFDSAGPLLEHCRVLYAWHMEGICPSTLLIQTQPMIVRRVAPDVVSAIVCVALDAQPVSRA
jgi:hypothetical protein